MLFQKKASAVAVSPAIAQLLFTFATKQLAGSWSVRQLAEVSEG